MTYSNKPKRAIIIGGSLGGLFSGAMLKSIGWDVDIYERSTGNLDSRGGGLVLQPDVSRILREINPNNRLSTVGVKSRSRKVFAPDGSLESNQVSPQTQTSWSMIYSETKAFFGDDHYHRGKELTRIEQNLADKTAKAIFADGTSETGDLIIGADGNGSKVRNLLWPNSKPTYAGYIAWRGLVHELDMPPKAYDALHGDFSFANRLGSHILGYLVPGDNKSVREGERLYNWVWYRTASEEELRSLTTDKNGKSRGYSLPEGLISDEWRQHVYEEAKLFLPTGFREVVLGTQEPFAQAIRDLTVPEMVKNRVILVGDAAFIPRPHTAARSSKAAANALALKQALLEEPDDLDKALASWQPGQLDLGNYLYARGTRAGDQLMFHKLKYA